MAAIRNKVEKLNQSREQGTLHHHQCIDELTSHLRNNQLKGIGDDSKIVSPTRSETPTSFVTVIEVKDPSPTSIATSQTSTSTSISIAAADSSDYKLEPTTPAPILPSSQQQQESKDETNAAEKPEENNASPVQTVEIRRKIPPR